MLQVEVGASVYWVRNRRETGRHPDDDDDAHRPRQTGSGLGPQRVTDGEVALDGERRDGEDRRG